MTKIHTHMHCLEAMHMCMYLHVCWHVYVQHMCTYSLDTALMCQDTCRYSQIDADKGACISHIHCAYVICIQLYPVHMCVCICALYVLHIHAHISIHMCAVWQCMCFTYMHICTGRITDDSIDMEDSDIQWGAIWWAQISIQQTGDNQSEQGRYPNQHSESSALGGHVGSVW